MEFNATSEVEKIILSIDEDLMTKYVQRLQDFKTRYSYRGDVCYDAAEYIKSEFDSNGLDTYYGDFIYNRAKMRNIIGVKPGVSSSNGTIIICAHYDSITPGSYPMTNAPGADDNGSGVAAVMAAAEILSDYDFNLTIKFIAFSGEEQGLKGSYNYRNGAMASGENITAVINLDMIANNPDPGSDLVKLYTGTGIIVQPINLRNVINETTARFGHIVGITPYLAGTSGSSDHQPFAAYYESIFFHEQIFSGVYHSTQDIIEYLNMTYCANVTQLAVATLAEIADICSPDTMPPAHTPGFPGNGTYAVALPDISIEFTDPGGIDPTSVIFRVNGMPVSPTFNEIPLGYNISFVPLAPFVDSMMVNVSVSASDLPGYNAIHNWSFIVDAVPPEPPSNFSISSSRTSLNKQGTVINIGSQWDLKHALSPSVLYLDGEYKMWYMASNSTRYHINYANSSDGVNWVKRGTVLLYTVPGQPDYLHVGYPEVIHDGEYKMWFSANNGTAWRIMYANSSDGITWTKHGVVLDLGAPGSLDDTNIYFASVIKTTGYRMWYTGTDGLKFSIMEAYSPDGLAWTKSYVKSIPIDGPGARWGDAGIAYPRVVYHDNSYHMWYNRIGENYYQTHYATSSDGYVWNDQGLAIGAGVSIGTHDRFQATSISAIISGNETKLWYSGYDGSSWRILFANITSGSRARDIRLSWTKSPSSDVVRYEVFRESRPSAFRYPLLGATPEYYAPPVGLTPWTFEKATEVNITVYGPVAGSDPKFFELPDDNILDLGLCMLSGTGEWQKLAQGTDYTVDFQTGFVAVTSAQFGTGSSIHAWYNHSAGRALRVLGNSTTDSGAADSKIDYYYVVRAVDRAGNHAQCTEMPGNMGIQLSSGWNLIGNPFLASQTPIEDALAGIEWNVARTWASASWPQWTSNRPGSGFNTLQEIGPANGVWLQMTNAENYSAHGTVSNLSINLVAGWNLVSFPYHRSMSVSQALAGVPWDRVEICDDASPTLLRQLAGNEILMPGQGLWVRVTSDAVWNVVNVP